MIAHLPKACNQLKEFKNDLKGLTKKDIRCILLLLFKVNMKESAHNKSQFVSELESKIQPLLVSNTNWIDEEKIKFMVSVNVSASQGNQKNHDNDVECNSNNVNEINNDSIEDVSDDEVIDALALL